MLVPGISPIGSRVVRSCLESDVVHEQLVMPHAVVRMIVAGLGVIALPVTMESIPHNDLCRTCIATTVHFNSSGFGGRRSILAMHTPIEGGLVLALNTLFFVFGWIFFSRVLYREYEVHPRRAQYQTQFHSLPHTLTPVCW